MFVVDVPLHRRHVVALRHDERFVPEGAHGIGDRLFLPLPHGSDAEIVVCVPGRLKPLRAQQSLVDLLVFAVQAGRRVDVVPVRVGFFPPADDRLPVADVDADLARRQRLAGKFVVRRARRQAERRQRAQEQDAGQHGRPFDLPFHHSLLFFP